MSLQKAVVFQDTRKYFAKEPFASAIKESQKGNVILHTPEQMRRVMRLMELVFASAEQNRVIEERI